MKITSLYEEVGPPKKSRSSKDHLLQFPVVSFSDSALDLYNLQAG